MVNMAKISTNIIMGFFGLKSNKNIEYSEEESRAKDVYIFDSREDFYDYFLQNEVYINDKELLDLAIFAEMKNGEVIAIKGLCDRIIKLDRARKNSFFPSEVDFREGTEKSLRKVIGANQ